METRLGDGAWPIFCLSSEGHAAGSHTSCPLSCLLWMLTPCFSLSTPTPTACSVDASHISHFSNVRRLILHPTCYANHPPADVDLTTYSAHHVTGCGIRLPVQGGSSLFSQDDATSRNHAVLRQHWLTRPSVALDW